MDLEGAMKATWKQLQVLRGSVRCDQAGAQKTCAQLTELGEALRSSEEGVLRAASALPFLVPWSPLNPASPGACVGIFAPVLSLTICPWCGVCLKGCLVSHWVSSTDRGRHCLQKSNVFGVDSECRMAGQVTGLYVHPC